MIFKSVTFVLLMFFALSSIASPVIDNSLANFNGIFSDHEDPNKFYFQPSKLEVVRDDQGVPQFKMTYFRDKEGNIVSGKVRVAFELKNSKYTEAEIARLRSLGKEVVQVSAVYSQVMMLHFYKEIFSEEVQKSQLVIEKGVFRVVFEYSLTGKGAMNILAFKGNLSYGYYCKSAEFIIKREESKGEQLRDSCSPAKLDRLENFPELFVEETH